MHRTGDAMHDAEFISLCVLMHTVIIIISMPADTETSKHTGTGTSSADITRNLTRLSLHHPEEVFEAVTKAPTC